MRRGAVMMVLGGFALAACGGDDGGSSSPPPDSAGTVDAEVSPSDVGAEDSLQDGASTSPDAGAEDISTTELPGGPDADVATRPAGSGLQVGPVPDSELDFAPYFQKHVGVFGLNVFATQGVPDADLLHAAAVLAQYLDNDEDGVPDDLAILDALQSGWGGPASLVMFATEWEIESSGIFESNLDSRALQDLYATETHPEGSSASGGFDATLEEVLHLVTHHGWAQAYPADFAEEPGTSLSDAMDLARGGQFMTIPNPYPDGAWYHYDDATCDYGCMATEYLYWALTSLLGAQSYPGRCDQIDHEWELCTPEQVKAGDVAITALLQQSGYALPTVLPDGSYDPPQ